MDTQEHTRVTQLMLSMPVVCEECGWHGKVRDCYRGSRYLICPECQGDFVIDAGNRTVH
jgi:predicted Zn-ribbon and HTH transcriptional regulator